MRLPLLFKSVKRRNAGLLFFILGIRGVHATAQEKASQRTINSSGISANTSQEPVIFEKVRGVIRYGDDGTGTKQSFARIRVQTYTGIQKVGQLVFPYKAPNARVDT